MKRGCGSMTGEKAPGTLSEAERKALAEAFLQEVEARLKKEEKHTWMKKDLEHLHQNQ